MEVEPAREWDSSSFNHQKNKNGESLADDDNSALAASRSLAKNNNDDDFLDYDDGISNQKENGFPRNSACFILGVTSASGDADDNDGIGNLTYENGSNFPGSGDGVIGDWPTSLNNIFMDQCFNIINNNNDNNSNNNNGNDSGNEKVMNKKGNMSGELMQVHESVENNKIWQTLADKFGMTMPVNWSKTIMKKYLISALAVKEIMDEQERSPTTTLTTSTNDNNIANSATATTTTTTADDDDNTPTTVAATTNNNLNINLDGNDEEDDEVKRAFDMHTLTLSSHHHHHHDNEGACSLGNHDVDDDDRMMFTADQVISEIEQMMEEDDDDDDNFTPCSSMENSFNNNIITSTTTAANDDVIITNNTNDVTSVAKKSSSPSAPFNLKLIKPMKNELAYGQKFGEGVPLRKPSIGNLTEMSVLQLCELYDDLEALCREYSEALVSELALRDELEYDKELRNQFITLFLSIQRKKRAHSARKKQNRKGGSGTQELSTAEKVYLTTTIPYNNTHSPPSSELLATYVKILKAMDNESPNLPMLLTEYILKVVCPTA